MELDSRGLGVAFAALLLAQVASPAAVSAQGSVEGMDLDALREALAPVPGGLTATQASERAIQVAPSLASERAQVGKAQDSVARLRDNFIPGVELNATYTRLSEVDQPTINFGGMEVTLFPQILDNYALRGTVTFPVSDYFLTLWPSYEGTRGFAEAAQHQLEATRAKTWLNAQELYYDYVYARGTVVVLDDAIQLLEANLSDVESMLAAGLATRADVELLKAELASARANRVQAQGGVVLLRRSLIEQLALEPREELTIGEDVFEAPPAGGAPDVDGAVDEALERRPEAQALRALLGANESLRRTERNGRLPRVFVQANADYANPNQRITPPEEEFNLTWSVTAGLSWSLGDALGAQHDLNAREYDLDSLGADQEALRRGIVLEVTQAITDLETTRLRREATLQRLEAAREGYRAQVLLQRAGKGTTTEVLQARNQMQQAQLEILSAQVGLRKARARLAYATANIPL